MDIQFSGEEKTAEIPLENFVLITETFPCRKYSASQRLSQSGDCRGLPALGSLCRRRPCAHAAGTVFSVKRHLQWFWV